MVKPVLLAVSLAVSASVGFIFGALFDTAHSKQLIAETITQRDESQKLLGWYQSAFVQTLVLNDLDSIKSIEDVEAIKQKYRRNGAADVGLFRKQAEAMRKAGAKEAPLAKLEAGIAEMQQEYALQAP